MAYPDRNQLRTSIESFLKNKGEVHVQEMYSFIENEYKMTYEEKTRMDNYGIAYQHEIRWALQDLKNKTVKRGSKMGYWIHI